MDEDKATPIVCIIMCAPSKFKYSYIDLLVDVLKCWLFIRVSIVSGPEVYVYIYSQCSSYIDSK